MNVATPPCSADSASVMSDIPRFMERLRCCDDIDALGRSVFSLSQLVGGEAEVCWSLAMPQATRTAIIARFAQLPGLRAITEATRGILIESKAGERCQMRYDFSQGSGGDTFVHILASTCWRNVPEIYAAVRWIHAEDAEEVLIRFRQSSAVFGKSVERSLPAGFVLLSLGRHKGSDVMMVDGVPIVWRPAERPPPTGIAMDFIGGSTGICRAEIPMIVVAHGALPFGASVAAAGAFLEQQIIACIQAGNLDALSRLMHAFEGLPHVLSTATYDAASKALLAEQTAYRDFTADLLVKRLPVNDQQRALDALSLCEPSPVVKLEGVGVTIDSNPSAHASLRRLFRKEHSPVDILRGISLRAYCGDIVGVLGKNGSGKTTLLRAMAAAMPLSRGRISVVGEPVLLRPGAGMHGDLSGEANIIRTGLYMGYLPHEIRAVMDEVIDFAELREHIHRPYRYYSDGMKARLVFAIATAIPRKILFLDELLSAGDMGFQKRAVQRLEQFIQQAQVVFVVQHSFDFVLTRCTKCLVLESGRPIFFGDPEVATEIYKESL